MPQWGSMPNTKFFATSIVAAGLFLAASTPAQQTPAANSATTPPAAAQSTPAAKSPHSTGAASPAAKPKPPPAPLALTTQKQKVSYAIGIGLGKNLKRDSVDIDPTILLRGLKDAMADAKPLLTDDEAKAAITQLQTEVRAKEEEKVKVAAMEN